MGSTHLKLKDDKTQKTVKDTANYINNYRFYGNIGRKLAGEQNTVHIPYSSTDDTYGNYSDLIHDFSREDVLVAICSLDSSKPIGIDDMLATVMKDFMEGALKMG